LCYWYAGKYDAVLDVKMPDRTFRLGKVLLSPVMDRPWVDASDEKRPVIQIPTQR
jgi:hypothetical protein